MSNSVLDKINDMIEEEKNEAKPRAESGKGSLPFVFALTLIICFALALFFLSLKFNLSYDLNVFLDAYMQIISILTSIILVLILIFSIVSMYKEFKILKIINLVLSFIGIFLAISPFIFQLLY